MNAEERKIFWDTLCSFDGNTPGEEAEKLRATIKYPKYLYRYRPMNTNNLEALRTNRLYFSTANYYDDPFDTFLHIDIDRVENELQESFTNPKILEQIAARSRAFASRCPDFFPEEFVRAIDPQNIQNMFFGGLGTSFLDHLLTLRNKVREDTWSVCFSENGFNETLWLKYADQYRGFSVIYDMEKADSLLCGTKDKCENCRFRESLPPLYPIHYSDTPYDATSFAKTVLMHTTMKESNVPVLSEIMTNMGPAFWEREKTTLIKKVCHRYDEEWRMIVWGDMKSPIAIEWIPSGVVLGLRMEESGRKLVTSIAKQAGIKHVYQSFINRKNQLDVREI